MSKKAYGAPFNRTYYTFPASPTGDDFKMFGAQGAAAAEFTGPRVRCCIHATCKYLFPTRRLRRPAPLLRLYEMKCEKLSQSKQYCRLTQSSLRQFGQVWRRRRRGERFSPRRVWVDASYHVDRFPLTDR
jgi:hypothetical protein